MSESIQITLYAIYPLLALGIVGVVIALAFRSKRVVDTDHFRRLPLEADGWESEEPSNPSPRHRGADIRHEEDG